MNQEFDVIIVGGGINGATLFHECSLSRLKTILIEREDFAHGTTGRCGGMLHGGLKYLSHDYLTTELTSKDSGTIYQMAKFLCFRIPFIYPFINGEKIPIDIAELGLTTYDRYSKYKGGIRHLRLNKDEIFQLEPRLSSDIKSALTFDEWGINPFRLTSLLISSGIKNGGIAQNHATLNNFITNDNGVNGIVCENNLNGELTNIFGKIVVLACGVWNPLLLSKLNIDLKLRPTKGIHLVFPGRISPYGFIFTAIDGRSIYLIPHETNTILGCTDDDYFGDLDNIEITQDEIEYLMEGATRYFPAIKKYKIIRAFAGVRPTLMERGKYEDDLIRDYLIEDHGQRDKISGLISISGGKFAGSLSAGIESKNMILDKLGKNIDQKRKFVFLPGGDDVLKEENLSYVRQKAFNKYGQQIKEIDEKDDEIICFCEMVTKNEILYVIKNELVKDLDDLRRRTRLSMGVCQGCRCIQKANDILNSVLNLSADEKNKYIEKRLKGIVATGKRGSTNNEDVLNKIIS